MSQPQPMDLNGRVALDAAIKRAGPRFREEHPY